MFEGLPSYPTYEDSGEPWMGQVPQGWELQRTKAVLIERSDKGHPEEPLLAATQTKGVVLKSDYENRTVLALKDLHLLKLVREGDFVISLRSFQGGIEFARNQGIISPAYTVLYPRDPDTHAYLAWLFKSRPYLENLSLHLTGIRQGQNIDYERLGRSRLPMPPPDAQGHIVRFLDHADRRIRRYIAATKKLITLLDEQKQAIIHRAVTRGLDPNVRLRQSGLEWLGEVPEHWEVVRLKDLVSRVTSGSRGWSDFVADDGPLFIRVGNLTRGSIDLDLSDAVHLDLPRSVAAEAERSRIVSGDLLLSITAFIGSVAVVPDGIEEAYVSQHVASCRPSAGSANARWLGYVLLSPVGQTHGHLSMNGGTKQGLSLDDVRSYPVLMPPRQEQDKIVAEIEASSRALDEATSKAQREVDLIREFRIRLIADVVTGKLDVRDAAAELPDTNEDPEPLDDAEDEHVDEWEAEADQGAALEVGA